MEAVVNGSVAAKRPSARSTTLDTDAARDLLNYFEIDENEKEFLISAITSSKAHEGEVKALLHDRAFSSPTSENDTSEDDDNQNDNAPTCRHSIPWRTPENPEAPPMDENTARSLLCGFNIDDDLREFLMAIIMSGKVFEDDLRQLYKIGLSAGWEAFQAQVQCAKSLRDKVLARHYGDDLTVYLGMLREYDHATDFRERYRPLEAPALNASDKLVAGKHLWGGLADGNTTSLQSIQLVHDDDSQVNNSIVHMDKPPPDCVASNPQPTKTASETVKKAKAKAQTTEQAPSSANDARFEVVCPIRRQDGSICNKRCYDGKAYRSMQEHIRKVHKDHYIPGLNANEESFRRMVNNTPGAGSNLQQATNGAKGPNEQVGDLSSQLVRPADLALPLANGAAVGAGKQQQQQRVAKKAKQSHERIPAKSPFFVDRGQNFMGVNISGSIPGMIPSRSALGSAFGGRQFLSLFDRGQDGFGAMSLGLDATISQSLFPQHVDGVAQSSVSTDRKRKRDGTDLDAQDQPSTQDLQGGLNGSSAELYNPPVDSSLFFQTLAPQSVPLVAPDVFDEMIDILGQLQEASRENQAARDMSGSTAGHYNPPAEFAAQGLSAKRNPFTSPTPPAKAKPAQKQAASPFFVSPSKKIDEARTATVTPSPTAKKTSRPARGTVSALPIPPLSGDRFGLVQEELAGDPFRLLVAVTFLIRTPGRVAIPVFRQLMERYPTPQALAEADPADIEAMTHHLGLSNQRTKTIQKYARTWLERPPSKDVRYGVKDYPHKGDGKDVRAGEAFGPEEQNPGAAKTDGVVGSSDSSKENDPQARTTARGHGTAWEIGHLTTGRYALDSWRIFCRDTLLGRAQDWKGTGRHGAFQPEWMRVLPEDKELRACLRWMWMREGWEWDPKTGEKTPLRDEIRQAVDEGRVAYDNQGQLQILEKADGQAGSNGGS